MVKKLNLYRIIIAVLLVYALEDQTFRRSFEQAKEEKQKKNKKEKQKKNKKGK